MEEWGERLRFAFSQTKREEEPATNGCEPRPAMGKDQKGLFTELTGSPRQATGIHSRCLKLLQSENIVIASLYTYTHTYTYTEGDREIERLRERLCMKSSAPQTFKEGQEPQQSNPRRLPREQSLILKLMSFGALIDTLMAYL